MTPASSSLLWLGLLEGPSGYADECRGFLRALERAGHRPAARAVLGDGGDALLGPDDRSMLARQTARSTARPRVAVHHYAPAWMRTGAVVDGVPNVARTMFETDRFPAAWLSQLLARDEVWVPSAHGADAFERGGIPASRLRVVGGTLDFDLYAPGLDPLPLPDVAAGRRVVLSTFDFSERKAWRQLLQAWAHAFDADDPVCLILKTAGRGDTDGAVRARVDAELAAAARRAGRRDPAPVHVLSGTLSTADLARLYAAADAFVLASRGEGWGRPLMEAMAMGVPTVGSRFGGNLAFMSDATSWLVDGTLVPVPADHGVFADDVRGHRWFEPDSEALAATLREIVADPDATRSRAAAARPDLLARFGPQATADRLATAVDAVAERHAATRARGCVLRGSFGRHQSLGVVNDRLLAGLEERGRGVQALAPGSAPVPSPDVSVSQGWPPEFDPASTGPAVVVLHWEYGDPPAPWLDASLTQVDRVVVSSDYVRDGYVAAGMPPGVVEVVPLGADLELYRPDGPRRDLGRTAGCVFLFAGGTIWRKGIDHLLAAWQRAFGPDDDVLLVVKDNGVDSAYRGQTLGAHITELAARSDVAPILYTAEHLAPEELPALYRCADVLVAPYRGEGFGLPILEAMACGVPPIHTAIGPSSEFVPADAGWAVPARRAPVDATFRWPLVGPGYVHDVDPDALVDALRAAAADAQDRADRGHRAAAAARRHGWGVAAKRMDEVLTTLEREALAPVRGVVAERPEGRATIVAYAPLWEDTGSWRRALAAWIAAVPEHADATLALAVGEAQADAMTERLLAVLADLGAGDGLDLTLLRRPDDDPLPLVLGADAVLLDDTQAGDPPAVLARRARRLLRLGELPAWGSTLKHVEHLSTTGA